MAMPLLPASPEAVLRAGALLRRGGLVAVPTETVYGLAADATDGRAVVRIFEAKGRPRFNPLIVHLATADAAAEHAEISPTARALMTAFWPGPLTLVLPKRAGSPAADLVTAGLDTIALRVPAHGVMRAVIAATGRPLAAPSANPSGEVSPTRAEHVAEGLGSAVDLILDGGPCAVGVESTVVAVEGDAVTLLRPGGLAREALEAAVGPLRAAGHADGAPRSPGQLARHYAPRARLRLEASGARPGEAYLGFGSGAPAESATVLNLSPTADLGEAAAHLFTHLRRLDATGVGTIAVAPVPDTGLGEAINDRLRRAARGRAPAALPNEGHPMPLDLPTDFLTSVERTVGAANMIRTPGDMAPYLKEWRDRYEGTTPLVVRPGSTAEVARLMTLCSAYGVAVTPQGGNTGLVGGQIPFGTSILLSLGRLNRIRAVDALNDTITVEAGVILADLQAAATEAGRFFPLSLASEGTCQIGGNLASNAGGVNVLRYGNARDQVLGLEVVLADGRVLDSLSGLRKDNTGYDLKQLFIGSEGTLGLITAATLKLRPMPEDTVTAMVGLATPEDAVTLLARVRRATGDLVSSFELMPRIGIDFVLAHGENVREPLPSRHPWYVLIEWSGGADLGLGTHAESVLGTLMEEGPIKDAVVAQSDAQAADLWRLRELISEMQKPEGGSIKHDVSVPVSAIPAFLEEAGAAVGRACPGARPVPFGHVGDGNIHFNISQPVGADRTAFLARWEKINTLVHDIAARHGGSISAEHGIGVMKRDALPRYRAETALDLMRVLKTALDPQGLLNPGKLL